MTTSYQGASEPSFPHAPKCALTTASTLSAIMKIAHTRAVFLDVRSLDTRRPRNACDSRICYVAHQSTKRPRVRAIKVSGATPSAFANAKITLNVG